MNRSMNLYLKTTLAMAMGLLIVTSVVGLALGQGGTGRQNTNSTKPPAKRTSNEKPARTSRSAPSRSRDSNTSTHVNSNTSAPTDSGPSGSASPPTNSTSTAERDLGLFATYAQTTSDNYSNFNWNEASDIYGIEFVANVSGVPAEVRLFQNFNGGVYDVDIRNHAGGTSIGPITYAGARNHSGTAGENRITLRGATGITKGQRYWVRIRRTSPKTDYPTFQFDMGAKDFRVIRSSGSDLEPSAEWFIYNIKMIILVKPGDRSNPTSSTADPVLFPPDTRNLQSGDPKSQTVAGPAAEKVYKADEVDHRAQVLEKPAPVYTEAARTNAVTGTVVLRAVLSSTGEVTNITVVRGLPDGLTERSIAAAKKIKFKPAMKDGKPVSQYVDLHYNLNLY